MNCVYRNRRSIRNCGWKLYDQVKPLDAECIELSKKCVLPLGYQGNNLLCSNWDREHLEGLDYNGLYEYLYQMKYQKRFVMEEGKNGIPAEEFEQLMSEYLPCYCRTVAEYSYI